MAGVTLDPVVLQSIQLLINGFTFTYTIFLQYGRLLKEFLFQT